MKTPAALLFGVGEDFVIDEVTIDDPGEGQIMVKNAASGICHSDHHLVRGHLGPSFFPILAGHEGAGTVVKVGKGVTRFKEGDHVLLTFIPSCGECFWCASGMGYLCDHGRNIMKGPLLDGRFYVHTSTGKDVGQYCLLGTFAKYTVTHEMSAVKLGDDLNLRNMCIVGCATPTGFGAAVNTANVQPGEAVAVFGVGGVGINAVQGAALKGAAKVIAVDPVDFKLESALKFGATHTINPKREDPVEKIKQLTYGVGARKVIITIDMPTAEDIGRAFDATSKGGRTVLTGVAHVDIDHVNISPFMLAMYKKELVGSLYGDSAVQADIPRYINLYRAGKLKVDELITRFYKLEQINEAMTDMLEGRNIRGAILYE